MRAEIQHRLLDVLQPGLCLTMDELAVAMQLERGQITNAALRLISRHLVERVERGCFQLTEAGIAAKRDGLVMKPGPRRKHNRSKVCRDSLRARLWRAARLKRKFTLPDLLSIACNEDETANPSNARRYISHLASAGYLVTLPGRRQGTDLTSNGFLRYSLVRDNGNRHPVLRDRADGWEVWDPNTREVFPCQP